MRDEDDYLQINGIQHYAFCPRQWALMENENQWVENVHTVEGHILHDRAHDNKLKETRGEVIIQRNLNIISNTLGIVGKTDVVEFRRNSNGICLNGMEGKFIPYVVEYKKGKPKTDNSDILQLVAQVVCLEEMLCCKIEKSAIFYWEIRSRVEVDISINIRNELIKLIDEMNSLKKRRHTPIVRMKSRCNACSFKDICLPELSKIESATEYINRRLSE
ncbi:CRISPR-associated protein Cas4 [Tissierella creatinini]|nr:CRISPR-associated protein Cas4 [Tissierella creatinini]TJX64645.1 CRISPR-associated protein Cas4 [Soehngenia saccharolytica]